MDGIMDGMITTLGVIQALNESSGILHQWGSAVDGTPIHSIQCGGKEKPAVMITAGVHAHEAAGVHAALQLAMELNARHEVYILPLRDPFGFSGVNHCLGFAAGKEILLEDDTSLLDFLFSHASQVWQWDRCYCFQIGEMGFIWQPQPAGLEGFIGVNAHMTMAVRDHPDVFCPLFGKHVMLMNPAPFTERNGLMARCWHAWISPEGAWLNLNRGFGEQGQPGEVAALQRALETIQPGLVIDLQEDDTPGFWFAAPYSQANRTVFAQVLPACLQAVIENQFPVYSAVQMRADSHRDLKIEGFLQPEGEYPGFFWLNQERIGQGQNLLSYAAGPAVAFGVESPMQRPLGHRVAGTVLVVSTLISKWESLLFHGKG
jgi:hypothetical protein